MKVKRSVWRMVQSIFKGTLVKRQPTPLVINDESRQHKGDQFIVSSGSGIPFRGAFGKVSGDVEWKREPTARKG